MHNAGGFRFLIMVRMRLQGLHQIARLLALGVQTGGVCPFGRVMVM